MATLVSPWVCEFPDYLHRKIVVTVNFDNTTHALINAVLHRDTGCLWHTVVFDVPSSANAKRIAAPADGAGDLTRSAGQLSQLGFSTIEQAMAVQITAEP